MVTNKKMPRGIKVVFIRRAKIRIVFLKYTYSLFISFHKIIYFLFTSALPFLLFLFVFVCFYIYCDLFAFWRGLVTCVVLQFLNFNSRACVKPPKKGKITPSSRERPSYFGWVGKTMMMCVWDDTIRFLTFKLVNGQPPYALHFPSFLACPWQVHNHLRPTH